MEISYNIFYADKASYTYTLDTKKIDILKPNTIFLKKLTFESKKKAKLELISNIDEVKLIDNDISKTTIQHQDKKEITYSVVINNNKLTLIDPKFSHNFISL